jgi:hypothetical protein
MSSFVKDSCDRGSLGWAGLFLSLPTMLWSHHYSAILTSAQKPYMAAKTLDRATILAEAVQAIQRKAKKDDLDLPEDIQQV